MLEIYNNDLITMAKVMRWSHYTLKATCFPNWGFISKCRGVDGGRSTHIMTKTSLTYTYHGWNLDSVCCYNEYFLKFQSSNQFKNERSLHMEILHSLVEVLWKKICSNSFGKITFIFFPKYCYFYSKFSPSNKIFGAYLNL